MMMSKIRFVEKLEEENSNSENIQDRKKKLRVYMKERRSQNENRDVKEALLIENFFQWFMSEMGGACTRRRLFVYLSFSLEAPTDLLIERLKEAGHEVYCPKIEKSGMQAVQCGEDFCLSHFGIREPIGKVLQGETDVIVLPLLAVDEKGNRLGYGKGYYDAYLHSHPLAKRVAYCYDFQICKNVPAEAWDEKIDVIITDKRVIHVKIQEKNGENYNGGSKKED